MRTTLAALLSLAALAGSAPAATDGVGPAVMLDTTTRVMAPQRYQSMCELAFGDSLYLVAWQDMRTGEDASGEYNWDIRVARVTPAGVLLDTLGIPVTNLPGLETYAAAAWDGTNWMVVWSDTRSGNLGEDLYGCRITPAGTPLDPNGFLISDAAGRQMLPSVEFDGTNYLVAWRDDQGGDWRIRAARVTPAAQVLDPGGIAVSSNPYSYSPAVAAGPGHWLVMWEEGEDHTFIKAARIAGDGTVHDPGGFVVDSARYDRYFPDADFDGANWLVAWTDRRRGPDPRFFAVYGARVDTTGTVLDPAGFEIFADDSYFSGYPDVCWSDTAYLVAWSDEYPLQGNVGRAARVTRSGQVIDPAGIPLARMGYLVGDLEWDGANWLAASPGLYESSEPGEGEDIRATRISPAGQVLDPAPHIWLSWSENWQYQPAAAAVGNRWLVTWLDKTLPDNFDIRGILLDSAGQLLDSRFDVSVATGQQWQTVCATGAGDTIALVVWRDMRAGNPDIYAARVTSSGTVLDPGGIAVASAGDEYRLPLVAFDGTNWLVTWWGWRTAFGHSIYGARVTPQGTVLDPEGKKLVDPTIISGGPGASAALSFDGSNYLLVWMDSRNGNNYDIYGARVTPAGNVLDPEGFLIVGLDSYWQVQPSVAFAGDRYLVFWQENDVYVARNVFFTVVDTSGVSLDSTGRIVCTAGGNRHSCRAGFDGENVLAVWTDSRGGNLYYARVTSGGSVLDPDGVPVAPSPGRQSSVDVAARGAGRVLFTWSGYFEERYATDRAVAALYESQSGILQAPAPVVGRPFLGTTVARGTLNLQSAACNLQSEIALLDISGRKAMGLRPGANDVSRLAPGVYFVQCGRPRSESFERVVLTK